MEKEKIKLLDNQTLLNKHLKIFNQGRWDDQDDLEEELLFRLNWKERLIKEVLDLKIDCLDSELDECINQEKVINLIKNFK